jgi:excisionase family DNA binding protein
MAAIVAERLNAAGWRPPERVAFNAPMIQRLAFRYGLGTGRPIWSGNVRREPGVEWTLQEVSARLGIHRHTAYRWLRRGRLRGRMASRGGQRIWIVPMSKAELDQLRGKETGSATMRERDRNSA